jgi:hypothetical protein
MKRSFGEIMRFGLLAAKKNTHVISWMSEFENITPKVYRFERGQCQSTKIGIMEVLNLGVRD